MLRDKALIPLSHQHQHALALCVFMERALNSGGADLAHWNKEIARQFEAEIRHHFGAEEKLLFPAAPPQLAELVTELLHDHATLRGYFGRASKNELTAPELKAFAGTLSAHVRKEERQFFEQLQQLLTPVHLNQLGNELQQYFKDSGMPASACELPDL